MHGFKFPLIVVMRPIKAVNSSFMVLTSSLNSSNMMPLSLLCMTVEWCYTLNPTFNQWKCNMGLCGWHNDVFPVIISYINETMRLLFNHYIPLSMTTLFFFFSFFGFLSFFSGWSSSLPSSCTSDNMHHISGNFKIMHLKCNLIMHEIHQIIINSNDIPFKQKMQESFTCAFLYPPCFFKWRCSDLTLHFVYILNWMGGRCDNGNTCKPTNTLS